MAWPLCHSFWHITSHCASSYFLVTVSVFTNGWFSKTKRIRNLHHTCLPCKHIKSSTFFSTIRASCICLYLVPLTSLIIPLEFPWLISSLTDGLLYSVFKNKNKDKKNKNMLWQSIYKGFYMVYTHNALLSYDENVQQKLVKHFALWLVVFSSCCIICRIPGKSCKNLYAFIMCFILSSQS